MANDEGQKKCVRVEKGGRVPWLLTQPSRPHFSSLPSVLLSLHVQRWGVGMRVFVSGGVGAQGWQRSVEPRRSKVECSNTPN